MNSDDLLYNLVWFLQHTGLTLLVCLVLVFLISRNSPINKDARLSLPIYFTWICIALLFCPEPFFKRGFHSYRMEILLAPGIASAFGILFALKASKGKKRIVKMSALLCLLIHAVILFLIIYYEFR